MGSGVQFPSGSLSSENHSFNITREGLSPHSPPVIEYSEQTLNSLLLMPSGIKAGLNFFKIGGRGYFPKEIILLLLTKNNPSIFGRRLFTLKFNYVSNKYLGK